MKLSNRFVSNDSIRSRYFHLINIKDKKYPFTEEENKKLMIFVERFGMKWSVFAEKFFPHKNSE